MRVKYLHEKQEIVSGLQRKTSGHQLSRQRSSVLSIAVRFLYQEKKDLAAETTTVVQARL